MRDGHNIPVCQNILPDAGYKYRFGLVISVYLSSLPAAHLSDAPRRRLVVTGDSARIPPGSLTYSAYSTVTRDLGITSHPKDY